MKVYFREGAYILGELPGNVKILGMTSYTPPGGSQRLVIMTDAGVWLADRGGELVKLDVAADVETQGELK